MTTEQALIIIYERYKQVTNDEFKARQTVSDLLFNIISKANDNGFQATPDYIKESLVSEAEFCERCTNSGAA